MGSSQGDLGWALAGEEAGGDGEAGERFDSPWLLSRYCREIWEWDYVWSLDPFFIAKTSFCAEVGESFKAFCGLV